MYPDNAKDEQLAEEADRGLRGQGAMVVMMKRLKEAVIRLDRSTTRLNRWMLIFTFAIFGLTVVQVGIQIQAWLPKIATFSGSVLPWRTIVTGQSASLGIGFALGIMGSLLAAIFYDRATRPKLVVVVDPTRSRGQVSGRAAHEFYHLLVRQAPTIWPFAGRKPAWDTKITVEEIDGSGKPTFNAPMVGRWTSQPEPLLPVLHKEQAGNLLDPARLVEARKVTVHSHEDQQVSLAIKYDGSPDCHLFSNDSYRFDKWQNPEWVLGPGTHRLLVTLFYERGRQTFNCTIKNCGLKANEIQVEMA